MLSYAAVALLFGLVAGVIAKVGFDIHADLRAPNQEEEPWLSKWPEDI